jgi:predicted enzyme related to lactoylglutathione lyase
MLRGFATINYFADDVESARQWYTGLLGIEPYFSREANGRVAYLEYRVGDYQHELGLIDSRYSPHGAGARTGGSVTYWHVDDVTAAHEQLLSMGAAEHEPLTERGAGFVTASVVDPFGNVLGIMHNPHYLEVLSAD